MVSRNTRDLRDDFSWILSQNRNPFRAALVGAFWGIGHTLTLLLVGLAVIIFKIPIPDRLALSMEFLVGIVLFVLGLQILWKFRHKRVHTHLHDHAAQALTHEHFHTHVADEEHGRLSHQYRSLLVGMIHGLAGSGALMLLLMGTLRTPVEGVAYIFIFGCGSILAMILVSMAIGLPVAFSAGRFLSFNRAIRLVAGAVSMMLGIVIIVEVGFIQGLFR